MNASSPVRARPARCTGSASRMTLLILVAAALAAILFFAAYDRRAPDSEARSSLLEQGMSPGHRMLNREAGRTLPSNSPRIPRADSLITRVSSRFRASKDHVADLALTTREMIAKHQAEDVLDVLEAALFATDGLDANRIPPLAPVLAEYARVRTGGANTAAARDAARSFAKAAAEDSANGSPRR